MAKRLVQVHMAQLAAASGVHMLADLFSNILPPILPAVRQHFGLGLFEGSILVVVLLLSSNWFQLLAGHLHCRSQDRSFMYIGLVLAVAVAFMGLVPRDAHALAWLGGLALVSGAGIAMVHPDALRCVHRLDRLPGAAATGVFMASGYVGYAAAGWISTSLVHRWGLKGLLGLVALPLVGVLAIRSLRLRPALEPLQQSRGMASDGLPFWHVMAMAIPAAVSTTTFATLLPTRLVDELGFSLRFGGLSATIYGLGGALGSVLWAMVASRVGELQATVVALGIIVPCTGLYLIWMSHTAAIVAVFLVGFFSFASFILLVSLARTARGANLSMRMACVVGGTWGVSNVVFLGLARMAEEVGTLPVMVVAPIGYLIAAVVGVTLWRRSTRASTISGDLPKTGND